MQSKYIKSILIAVGATLGAFVIALGGAYYVMPMVAPATVAQAQPDSLAASATADSTGKLAHAAAKGEGLAVTEEASDSSRVGAIHKKVETLQDSLQALQAQLDQTREENTTLNEKTAMLRKRLSAAESSRAKADEMSSALVKMEKRELNALLKDVNMRVLEQLYREASGRARTRLLEAMAPARAARFVNQMVEAPASGLGQPSSTTPSAASSVEAAPAATPSS